MSTQDAPKEPRIMAVWLALARPAIVAIAIKPPRNAFKTDCADGAGGSLDESPLNLSKKLITFIPSKIIYSLLIFPFFQNTPT
jgi:hypothetical protein